MNKAIFLKVTLTPQLEPKPPFNPNRKKEEMLVPISAIKHLTPIGNGNYKATFLKNLYPN